MQEESFETAFKRLEAILHQMNEGKASLDESVKLFIEADGLIQNCSQKLNAAEQKIQTLIKNREGKLELDEKGAPKTASFEEVPF